MTAPLVSKLPTDDPRDPVRIAARWEALALAVVTVLIGAQVVTADVGGAIVVLIGAVLFVGALIVRARVYPGDPGGEPVAIAGAVQAVGVGVVGLGTALGWWDEAIAAVLTGASAALVLAVADTVRALVSPWPPVRDDGQGEG